MAGRPAARRQCRRRRRARLRPQRRGHLAAAMISGSRLAAAGRSGHDDPDRQQQLHRRHDVAAGTLQIGNGGTTGSIVGNVVNDGVLAFNRSNTLTLAVNISGSGSVQQVGSGITILSRHELPIAATRSSPAAGCSSATAAQAAAPIWPATSTLTRRHAGDPGAGDPERRADRELRQQHRTLHRRWHRTAPRCPLTASRSATVLPSTSAASTMRASSTRC